METTPADKQLDRRSSEFVNAVLDGAYSRACPPGAHRDWPGCDIDWVTCKDFTVDLGKEQIEKFMGTWEMHPSWRVSVEFIQETELELQNQYHYRARWSLPTSRRPIPRSTASVYFTIKTSKIKPRTLPVEVHYQVESNRTVHVPGKTRFREKWLKDVIASKALLQDYITF